jgi:hypothetical protein
MDSAHDSWDWAHCVLYERIALPATPGDQGFPQEDRNNSPGSRLLRDLSLLLCSSFLDSNQRPEVLIGKIEVFWGRQRKSSPTQTRHHLCGSRLGDGLVDLLNRQPDIYFAR